MKTFSITTLGCRVNHYESEQIAQVLRARGLRRVEQGGDVRVVHTCSVTMHAAKDSRKAVRKATRLNVLGQDESVGALTGAAPGGRVIVTGCWATSDRAAAEAMPGVDAVVTHHDDVSARLDALLDEWMLNRPGSSCAAGEAGQRGFVLPILHDRQSTHQRAFLKVQDGCDAHCTYCIIPRLRPTLSSKPVDDAVAEAQALVRAGHRELVLTGIFLGAFGQSTALRRRQNGAKPIVDLIDALCTRVPGLLRLRLSSLEPGDLDDTLIRALARHQQVVPHFHLPLQSGSDRILRRMNRQYDRTQYMEMIDRVNAAFDRPAITTDILCGFPGEADDDFAQTLDVAGRARFIHTHAFSYSPRPGTAAARWTEQHVRGPVVNQRINALTDLARTHSLAFRSQFVNEEATVLVEHGSDHPGTRHGRSERYFDIRFEAGNIQTGEMVRVRIERATPTLTHGRLIR